MKLHQQFLLVAQRRRLAKHTIDAYWLWIRQYLQFTARRCGEWKHPIQLATPDVEAFLNHLVGERRLSASSQNQALNALVFLYSHAPGWPGCGETGRCRHRAAVNPRSVSHGVLLTRGVGAFCQTRTTVNQPPLPAKCANAARPRSVSPSTQIRSRNPRVLTAPPPRAANPLPLNNLPASNLPSCLGVPLNRWSHPEKTPCVEGVLRDRNGK
jgi:hypothetical protein